MSDVRKKFGKSLKRMVSEKQDLIKIGGWAYSVFLDWPNSNDVGFTKLLLHLGTLELGEEFAIPYEELDEIADDLIAGKDVELK